MYEPFLFLMSLNGSYILGQSVSNVTTIPGSWFPRQCRRWECEKTAKQCVYGKVWTCFQSRHSGCVCYHTSLVTEKTDKELRPRVCVILPRGCVILPRGCVILPRRCVILPRVCVILPRGCVILPRGCAILPRGCVILPRGCAVLRVIRQEALSSCLKRPVHAVLYNTKGIPNFSFRPKHILYEKNKIGLVSACIYITSTHAH